MLALSVRQPYADQIIRGTKRIEYRTVRTNIRERSRTFTPVRSWARTGRRSAEGVVIGTVEAWRCSGAPKDYRWHLARSEAPQEATPTAGQAPAGLVHAIPLS